MRRLLFAAGILFALNSFASAENLVFVRDGKLRSPAILELKDPGTFDMCGVEVADWPALAARDSEYVRGVLQPLALHGLNTIAISLQGPTGAGRFWSPDGKAIDAKAAKAFTDFSFRTRDYGFALVVSMFGADRSCWLESADAYREAVKSVVRLLPAKHSCIFIVGHLLGPGDWKGSPFQKVDAIDLCGLIKKTRGDTVIGLPVHLANLAVAPSPGSPEPVPHRRVAYAAQTSEDLQRYLKAPKGDRESIGGCTMCCWPGSILFREDVKGDHAGAVEKFAMQVERERVSAKLPAPKITGKPTMETLSAAEKADGWGPLFDGTSLDGWTTLTDNWGGWSVENGELKCAGTSGPWIRTVRRFSSFALRLEFNISPNGNSGVFVRAPYDARCSRFGMEVQILGTHKDAPDRDTTGAIYSVLAPRADAGRKPGEWNDLEVTCDGPHVAIRLNGQIVQDFHTDADPELAGRLKEGCIGLQDHGNPVSFRKIRIRGHESAASSSP